MQETRKTQQTGVQSLGWEDSLKKEMATHSSILALKIPWTEELGAGYYPWGHKESGTTEWLHFRFHFSLRVRQKGQGSLRQATTYVYNNKTSKKKKSYSQRNISSMESNVTLPGYNYPLSMSIPPSCGKGDDNYSFCWWLSLGMSAISARAPNVEICLSLFLDLEGSALSLDLLLGN